MTVNATTPVSSTAASHQLVYGERGDAKPQL